ncbi:glycosyltransferase [Solidesulfovibrio magneticus]|uniref:Glycosyltransferase n=1 Tax=Solidesulfovibrio magneticus (strain ATCC 700980 / DSM 13731 / RS-1) TaxID=573370 RepID=C4XP43_SOLM1|nr:glycosyltransferase [Solidesulfovibrio magneticus]BAH77544.1 hypothetical protein DMR_40530 [Solidesulfovibrio magneticus RS-1]
MRRQNDKNGGKAMRLAACFSQMGGLRGLLPLLTDAADFDIRWHGREPALAYIRARGHEAAPLNALRLAPEACDVLLTDTINLRRSDEGLLCREAWRAAAETGTPSVAFVDSWWGYLERFTLPGERLANAPLPDVIAVVDEIAHKDMLALGFPEQKLHMLGSPWLSSLVGDSRDGKPPLGGDPDEIVLTFVSQPLARVLNDRDSWGFTERDVIPALVRACTALPVEIKSRLRFVCLAHPEEDEAALAALLSETSPDFKTEVRKEPDPLGVVRSSHAVVGMFSILLVEAALCRRPVLSVQPGLKREDMLATNRCGATAVVREIAELPQTIERLLCDKGFQAELLRRQANFPVIAEAIERWRRMLQDLSSRCRREDR